MIGLKMVLVMCFLVPTVMILWAFRNLFLEELNYVEECPDCKMMSRRGMVKLATLDKETERSWMVCCPHCNDIVSMTTRYNAKPLFAPRLNIVNRIKVHLAIKNHNTNKDAAKQMEHYLNLQEKKLEKMIESK